MKMRTMKIANLIAVGVVVAALAACSDGTTGAGASSGGGDAADVIKIGTLHPLTGGNAGDGVQLENGAKLAIEAINEAGGIEALGGAKLELAEGDTKGAPDTAQAEAQRLISEGAVALIGTYQSAVSANVAAVAERNKIPFVMDISGDDAILSHGYSYSFRLQPQNSRFGAATANYIAELAEKAGTPVTKIAYLHESTAFGQSVYDAFAEEAKNLGLEMGPEITYDAANVSDLTTEITQVKASGANVLVVSGYYRDGVLAAKAVSTVKPALDAVVGAANGAFDQPQFPTDAGSAANGYFDVNYHLADDEEARAFAELYEATYGETARTGAALAYDAIQVIAAGLEAAASTDTTALRDAIAESRVEPLALSDGPITFSDTGENTASLPVLTQIQDGKPVVVYPAEQAATEPIWPADPGQ